MKTPVINKLPKISFGIIVLNGEPFTRYCIKQLYPHAHQIIVVEGGSEKAKHICPNGTSNDGTLEVLRDFKENNDPDNKIIVVTKDGFWNDKDEQSQAYADKATGDYLWQIDIDEFYKDEDIERIRSFLADDPSIDAVSFRQITFWGSIKYWCNSVYLTTVNASEYHRLFKWGKNYKYTAHRPPTIVDEAGINLRTKNWLSADVIEKKGINLYHYSLLFPKQVKEKCKYYSTPGESYKTNMDLWAENYYFKLSKPFRLHNVEQYPSWIMRYKGLHPREVNNMFSDVNNGNIDVELRNTDDVEALLDSSRYKILRSALIFIDKIGLFKLLLSFRSIVKKNI
jgi:hypothetical protein